MTCLCIFPPNVAVDAEGKRYCRRCGSMLAPEDLATDGGHLPSDPSPSEDQWAAINYEELYIDIRFALLWCEDCSTYREHLIERDTNHGTVYTECESCHEVDLVKLEES